MNKLLKFLKPIDNLIWNYFVKSKFILFCGGGKTVVQEAAPRNMTEDAKDYLEAITDPELIGRQLDAEREFGPQFDLVSLSRTQTMLEGIKDPKDSQAYRSATARRIALQAKKKALEAGEETMSQEDIDNQISAILGPPPPEEVKAPGNQMRENPEYVEYQERKKILAENYGEVNTNTLADVEADLAKAVATITQIENAPPQKGLLQMADEAAKKYDEIISRSNTLRRERDVLDLETLGEKTTEALRKSDPYSTGIADKITELAEKASDRALADSEPSAERTAMGNIASRQIERISELEARA